jgi:hypothetical protein
VTTAREAIEQADFMNTLWTAELSTFIQRDLDADTGRWVWDPQVDGVVGFEILRDDRWEIVVIVWLEAEDFSCNEVYAETGEKA